MKRIHDKPILSSLWQLINHFDTLLISDSDVSILGPPILEIMLKTILQAIVHVNVLVEVAHQIEELLQFVLLVQIANELLVVVNHLQELSVDYRENSSRNKEHNNTK